MNSDELGSLMRERTELEEIKKSRRLNEQERIRYNELIYLIQEYISNENNLIFD